MAKVMKKKKNITLDDLAGMVKCGFDGVDKRFEQAEEHFDRIENALKLFKEENSLGT